MLSSIVIATASVLAQKLDRVGVPEYTTWWESEFVCSKICVKGKCLAWQYV
ncbi:hypothetical protein WN55_04240 [Dufourea novaeangliae]|uniref:Uncharacterized protein n=1 Tax=Dufourea novaeangliae TaxID=178035 RepID=A0A154NXG2_DUFNO|nr:hypothetical protein WN55_04240 [Dufourea novaeangliae]